MPRKRSLTVRDVKASTWTHPIGTDVVVLRDDGSELHTKTRSEAWDLCGTGVVMVDGISGGYALSRVRPVTPTKGPAK